MDNADELRGSGAGQGFGTAGFVIGLIALIISFIPCLGMYAFVPGIIALIFSIVALTQASRANASRGLIIAALVISSVATVIASWQLVMVHRAAIGFGRFGTEMRDAFGDDFGDEIREKVRRALEDVPDFEELPEEDTLGFDADEMIEELERLEKDMENDEEP
jgi:hypothetical protein